MHISGTQYIYYIYAYNNSLFDYPLIILLDRFPIKDVALYSVSFLPSVHVHYSTFTVTDADSSDFTVLTEQENSVSELKVEQPI